MTKITAMPEDGDVENEFGDHDGEAVPASGQAVTIITLPFPPASLSGHAKGHWRAKSGPTAKHREWARLATLAAGATAPPTGDIRIHIKFVPPDRRGDRTNFSNRMKAALDGIATALGVNDARFLPAYEFADPEKPGRVEVTVEAFAPQGGDA